ncbi:hypothetical protein HC723_15825 [Vibrio sp. S11_S32]|uniref:hypothetical protein n=1 Tax=Vibrio sp. S11_S32 TaxID=2720225 RepID=UPI0016806AE3|nr:hypothetical protein [Vibrio sp. S11_S32]MBD1577865.1 hypothetical protein [Vibrio sp. S11_S32]
MKKNIFIASLFFVAVHANADMYGDIKQKSCIHIATPPSEDIIVDVYQDVQDYDLHTPQTRPVRVTQDTITIKAGTTEKEYCSSMIGYTGYHNSTVGTAFNVFNSDKTKLLDSFYSYSNFNGDGANNDWDLNEFGSKKDSQCNAKDETQRGVHLWAVDNHGTSHWTCSPAEDIPDENTVHIVFTPNFTL